MSPRQLVSISDLDDIEVEAILARAHELADGAAPKSLAPLLVGLVFMETSLRTRVGFAAASYRCDANVVTVIEQRSSSVSMPESIEDTLRTVAGYVDGIVARPGASVAREVLDALPLRFYISGGETGHGAEHPTQALVDIFAMERLAGPIGSLSIAICGDLRMRAAQSLLGLLERRQPKALVALTHAEMEPPNDAAMRGHAVTRRTDWEIGRCDILYVVGMPHEALALDRRNQLILDSTALERLPSTCIVLSPMPVIDEIAPEVRGDPRIRFQQQSDLALHVRTAIIEHLGGL